jgi:hypothetical protein
LTPSDRVINSPPDSLIEGEKLHVAGASFATIGVKPIAVASQ